MSLISCDRTAETTAVGSEASDEFDSHLLKPNVDKSRVLATVNDTPIYREDLEEYLRAGVSADSEEALLDEAIREFLLADEARRRGYASDRDVVNEFRKALALELLVRQGRAFTEKSISDKTLKQAFDRQKNRFIHGDLRTVLHALVPVSEGKTVSADDQRLAERIRTKLLGVTNEDDFRNVVGAMKKEHAAAGIVVEKLPPFDADSSAFVKPFVDGAFAVAYPKARISGVVETRFGLHVIFVVSQTEASNVTFSEARDILAKEMVEAERRRHIVEFIDRLEKTGNVFVYDEVLSQSLEWDPKQ